jgi:predicted amidohydrolase
VRNKELVIEIVYQIKGWNLLLQVCYDLRFPVFSRNRTINNKKEYDVIIYVANWPKIRSFIWANLLQARAIENQVYSIGVNRVGVDVNHIDHSGDSSVINPWGQVIYKSLPNQPDIQLVQLKKSVLENINTKFPAYLDADEFTLNF